MADGPSDDDALSGAFSSFGNDVEALADVHLKDDRKPATLFHFTDCDGLRGIFGQKSLRASLATALSDASETKYALWRLRGLLASGKLPPSQHLSHDLLEGFLEGREHLPGVATRDYRCYVASFCGASEAIHWLHYGRSGTGVAIELDLQTLREVPQFTLCPVVYDKGKQDEFLFALAHRADAFIAGLIARFGDEHRDSIGRVGAHTAVALLRLHAARMKDPAFRSEDEWRLFSHEIWKPGEAETPTRETHFRSVNGRIVPYKEIVFDSLPIRAVVLGSSSPMQVDEQALAVMMESALGKAIPVTRSSVLVRP